MGESFGTDDASQAFADRLDLVAKGKRVYSNPYGWWRQPAVQPWPGVRSDAVQLVSGSNLTSRDSWQGKVNGDIVPASAADLAAGRPLSVLWRLAWPLNFKPGGLNVTLPFMAWFQVTPESAAWQQRLAKALVWCTQAGKVPNLLTWRAAGTPDPDTGGRRIPPPPPSRVGGYLSRGGQASPAAALQSSLAGRYGGTTYGPTTPTTTPQRTNTMDFARPALPSVIGFATGCAPYNVTPGEASRIRPRVGATRVALAAGASGTLTFTCNQDCQIDTLMLQCPTTAAGAADHLQALEVSALTYNSTPLDLGAQTTEPGTAFNPLNPATPGNLGLLNMKKTDTITATVTNRSLEAVEVTGVLTRVH